ncbi:hypothetical protein D1B31_16120 [Neobacillus notoginsengisoli]|uniref:Uncharacterized protein n=1 Tax=Neobacillus notoginsengisoli TaxID=1578198 RepID=A0A417YRN7_9BACI|nr:hypothetical protein [Neobacillus notoginsengisoli]RHW37293.1 hypothetical protein D1B31_16120 [Neobacillus notoginsengisoli]
MEILKEVDGILAEAIESLDRGEKVNGLEYARKLLKSHMANPASNRTQKRKEQRKRNKQRKAIT